MGLDVTAYERTKFHKPEDRSADEDLSLDGFTLLYKIRGVPDRSDGLHVGWHRHLGEVRHFHIGAYSYYSRWREQLAGMLGTTPDDVWRRGRTARGPFVELIAFADNEGFFGPKTSAKLAADFITHRADAQAYAQRTNDPEFLETYDQFGRAFALAAGHGVVKFH